ncbi:MAG: hypothetical protein RLZZ546_3144 [Bacteroidota bacterium]|jgi:hypothetical protein
MKQISLLITALLFFSYSYCCTCIGKATFKKEYKRSNVVMTGKVLDKKIIEVKDSLMPLIKIQKAEYTVQIIKIYKGKIKKSTIIITTGLGGGDCGFEFNIGNEYIIYCSYENKYYEQGKTVNQFLHTGICRRTRLINDKEELKLLNKKCRKTKAPATARF